MGTAKKTVTGNFRQKNTFLFQLKIALPKHVTIFSSPPEYTPPADDDHCLFNVTEDCRETSRKQQTGDAGWNLGTVQRGPGSSSMAL
jgi:hypothetical protein